MDGGGIQISTANGVAAIVFLVGAIGTLLKLIRDQYAARLADRDQVILDYKARIVKFEESVKTQDAIIHRAVDVLERTGDILERSTVVTEEVVRKVPSATRRRAAS